MASESDRMDFGVPEEARHVVETARRSVATELQPLDAWVEAAWPWPAGAS